MQPQPVGTASSIPTVDGSIPRAPTQPRRVPTPPRPPNVQRTDSTERMLQAARRERSAPRTTAATRRPIDLVGTLRGLSGAQRTPAQPAEISQSTITVPPQEQETGRSNAGLAGPNFPVPPMFGSPHTSEEGGSDEQQIFGGSNQITPATSMSRFPSQFLQLRL